jgi:hypothetical protein
MNFAADAAELRQQEIARLRDALVPRLEALRSMTPVAFRYVVADMWHRFGHEIVNDPAAPELVTTKNGRKFVTACAAPADPTPTGTQDIARLHDAVIAHNAERGFFVSVRGFTDQAQQYANTAPVELIDAGRLVKALNQSKKHVLLPQTYKAMCCQCGEIVQHRLDREQNEARPCGKGHMVAPTIARAMLLPPRPAGWKPGDDAKKPAPRPYSRREIRAHNAKYEARMMKQPRPR